MDVAQDRIKAYTPSPNEIIRNGEAVSARRYVMVRTAQAWAEVAGKDPAFLI
jgi:hypothetical protein